jgi:hypothetical protein
MYKEEGGRKKHNTLYLFEFLSDSVKNQLPSIHSGTDIHNIIRRGEISDEE